MIERMKAVRTELGDLVLERLRRLPTQVRFPLEDGGELLLVHGSPADPAEAMSHDMSDEELSALIGDDPADLVVCGMSHVPFDRIIGHTRIVNVGSVGEAPDNVAASRQPDGRARDVDRVAPVGPLRSSRSSSRCAKPRA